MERTAVNPWQWSMNFGFNQGELIEGASRTLFCSGQTSVDTNGAPQHPGDMAAQLSLALDNLEAVLRDAGMGLGNLVRLNFYTTDVDAYLASSGSARAAARRGRRDANRHVARRRPPRVPRAHGRDRRHCRQLTGGHYGGGVFPATICAW